MFWHHKEINFSETISQTLFLTALSSFVVFLSLDLLLPGFVSRILSVHWFLLVAMISGVWWGIQRTEIKDLKISWWLWIVTSLFSVVFVGLLWSFRADLSDFLVLVLPLAFMAPFLVILLARRE